MHSFITSDNEYTGYLKI